MLLLPYVMAVGSNLFFGVASIYYATYSRRFSVVWMNLTKTGIAWIACGLFLLLTNTELIRFQKMVPFLISGGVGLGLGDFFMLMAFFRIGASRTLMLWGFQPVIIGLGCYFVFGDVLGVGKIAAIILMILCLFTFSYEGFRKNGHWEVRGLLYALIGVCLDSTSAVGTKWAFEQAPTISPLLGQFLRCGGALSVLYVIYLFTPKSYFVPWTQMNNRERRTVFLASFIGTFLALFLSLSAIKTGHLPSLAAIGVTCPLFSGLFEHLYEKRWPSRTFLLATGFFLIGFMILILSDYY